MERLKMTIVKPLKNSNLPPLQKKSFPPSNKSLLTTMIFSSLIGTYLDLFFVGKGLYSFPKRPFPEVFSINVLFTLLALPVLMGAFILICRKLNKLKKALFILSLSLLITVLEKQSEALGFFVHHDSWNHLYSTFGYTFYFIFFYWFYQWLNR